MKSGTGVLFLLIITIHAFGKRPCIQGNVTNTVYLEVAGTGGYGSLNYERLFFSKNMFSLSAACGISSYHLNDFTGNFNPDLTIPFMLHACAGRDHKIEIGAGQTFGSIVHAGADDNIKERKSHFHTIFAFGYRYQKSTGGIFFRCSYTPLLEFNSRFRNWGGISVGYSF